MVREISKGKGWQKIVVYGDDLSKGWNKLSDFARTQQGTRRRS